MLLAEKSDRMRTPKRLLSSVGTKLFLEWIF
nr:MAG TPA: hypothetical protein [Caudoviricetes sp.]